jgi:Mg2+-importing ATPase
VTQTLVIYAIRTARSPFSSRPSTLLVVSTTSIVALSMALTFTRLGAFLGFSPMPATFLIFLVLATVTYLLIVAFVKRRVLFFDPGPAHRARPRAPASPMAPSGLL